MAEPTDHELLTRFARTGDEAAFATLVTRHVNLVWSAARRFTGDDTLAGEVTQAVFIILAQKAGRISAKTVLTGWLYQTARLTAANALKENRRRQQREHQAYMEATLTPNETNEAWQQLAPVLDEAMHALRTADRDAVLLRFFENKTLADVGAALGVTEDAARVRVNRALDKLRALLAKQGIKFGATLLATAVVENSLQAAPTALAAKVSVIAAKGAATTTSITTLVKGTLKIMAWTKAQTAIVVGAVVLLAAGTTTSLVVHHKHTSASVQIHILARFIEIPQSLADSQIVNAAGILDANSAKTLLQTLKSQHGVKILSQPEITTLGGRQCQIQTTRAVAVITNATYAAGSITMQTATMNFGSVLDVIPKVTSDGKLEMTTMASVSEFFGYADGSQIAPDNAITPDGQKITLPIYLPAIQIKKSTSINTLADGQTLLMVLNNIEQPAFSKTTVERQAQIKQHIAAAERKNGEREILVLVTADFVDAAGNLIKK